MKPEIYVETTNMQEGGKNILQERKKREKPLWQEENSQNLKENVDGEQKQGQSLELSEPGKTRFGGASKVMLLLWLFSQSCV